MFCSSLQYLQCSGQVVSFLAHMCRHRQDQISGYESHQKYIYKYMACSKICAKQLNVILQHNTLRYPPDRSKNPCRPKPKRHVYYNDEPGRAARIGMRRGDKRRHNGVRRKGLLVRLQSPYPMLLLAISNVPIHYSLLIVLDGFANRK